MTLNRCQHQIFFLRLALRIDGHGTRAYGQRAGLQPDGDAVLLRFIRLEGDAPALRRRIDEQRHHTDVAGFITDLFGNLVALARYQRDFLDLPGDQLPRPPFLSAHSGTCRMTPVGN